ncbi:hypothetical protein [Ralstonia solanacearum]|uniref:hypothetical protein n=1 Tax=Ralstonia solanacearum TaxID=305 RepID=UPI001E2A11B6|nr:hypothetical protein [Ralstonia solanacearum]
MSAFAQSKFPPFTLLDEPLLAFSPADTKQVDVHPLRGLLRYPFEEVMFRWDHVEKKAYRKFYRERESGLIPHDNNLYNETLRSGDEITREAYTTGKPGSPERRNS